MKHFFYIRAFALFLILVSKASNVEATILVLVVTNKSIYLGADSKRVAITATGISDEVIEKLVQKRGIYFAVSGLSRNDDNSFSIDDKISEIIEQYKTFHKVREVFPKIIESYILDHVNKFRSINPKGFDEIMKVNRGGAIFFCTIVEGIPWAYLVEYTLEVTSKIEMKISWGSTNIEKIPESECFWRSAGNVSFLNQYILSEKDIDKDPICFISQLIQTGISEKPEYVGEPIKIIELKPNGVEYIQVKDDCTKQFFR